MFVFSFGMLMYFMMGGALRSAGDARTPLMLGIVMTVLNVGLNMVLITGWGPFRRWARAARRSGTCARGRLVSGVRLWLMSRDAAS